IVPTSGDEIAFSISGPGRIIGVGNGDPSSHEPDRATKRGAFTGLCMALVQATAEAGTISIRASAEGLEGGSTEVPSRPATARSAASDFEHVLDRKSGE